MTDVFLFLPYPFWRRAMSLGYKMRAREKEREIEPAGRQGGGERSEGANGRVQREFRVLVDPFIL